MRSNVQYASHTFPSRQRSAPIPKIGDTRTRAIFIADDLAHRLLRWSPLTSGLRRSCEALEDHARERAGTRGEALEAPRVLDRANASLGAIRAHSEDFSEPLVIRGLFSDTPAVRTWTPEWFAEHHGGQLLHAVDHAIPAVRKLTIREFVEGGRELYLAFWPELFRACPGLFDDLAFAEVLPSWEYRDERAYTPFTAEFFFGHGWDPELRYAGTRLHCAPHGNVFAQIYGRKTWTFIHPRYTLALRPILQQTFAVSALTPRQLASARHDWIPRVRVTLEPGDGLINPPWTWHQVANEGFCIGIASREAMVARTVRQNPLFSALRPLITAAPGLNKSLRLFSGKRPLKRYADQDRKAHEKGSRTRRRIESMAAVG